MKNVEKRSIGGKLMRSVCSLALIGATTSIAVSGFSLVAALVLVSSFGGIAVPAVAAAENAVECVTGFVEILVDGMLSVFSLLADIFGGLFG